MDRLAHFDINIKHIAGKHLKLTDYLSRNPISKPEPNENYDEKYVINCVVPLLEFINTHGSITDEKKVEAQTDEVAASANNQSQTRSVNKIQLSEYEQDKQWSLKSSKSKVRSNTADTNQTVQNRMDIKTIESIEKDDPSEETLRLTTRWKEITKPGDYRFTQGQWKKYNPSRALRAEQKRIEVELWQKRNRLLWKRMEINSRETEEELDRKREFHRVIEKIRAKPKRDDTGTSSITQQPQKQDEIETMSSDSDQTIAVPAINFKRYLGATSVRYIQMGTASKVQYNEEWDLEETIRQAEQKFSTDLRTIADETTNDEKLIKTLVCLERRSYEQIPDEYKEHHKNMSTRFGVVFYNDKIVIPKPLRKTVILLLHKGHPAINKMTHAAKPFWWPKLNKDIQTKCNECIPCKMSGKSIKPQIPMTEINFLPPVEKPNEEIQLDFIGPIRFKHRRFYILISIDRYSRWPAACICEAPTGKTAKNSLQQYILLNGIPQVIRTDKGTAFTGKEFRQMCKNLHIKLIYGTPYIHTATGLVERGIKTLKDLMRTNLEDKCNLNDALYQSLMVMRMTIHSKTKETPFERHYGRKPRTELTSYLNLPTDKNDYASAQPETLQVYSFNNGRGGYDQLIMKSPRQLKCDVSNNLPYKFLEKKQNKNKFESEYDTNPQIAVAETKHTITTDTNKIIHKKRISKPLPNSFQNPLSRRGENRRGIDGRFVQTSIQSDSEDEKEEEEETQTETDERRASTPTAETSVEGMETSFDFTPPIQIGRGRKKTIKEKTPGENNLKLHVDRMSGEQLEQAMEAIAEDPTTITIVDNNGNENQNQNNQNQRKTEITELPDTIETNNTNIQTRKSSRIRTNNPIIRYGNPVTF